MFLQHIVNFISIPSRGDSKMFNKKWLSERVLFPERATLVAAQTVPYHSISSSTLHTEKPAQPIIQTETLHILYAYRYTTKYMHWVLISRCRYMQCHRAIGRPCLSVKWNYRRLQLGQLGESYLVWGFARHLWHLSVEVGEDFSLIS